MAVPETMDVNPVLDKVEVVAPLVTARIRMSPATTPAGALITSEVAAAAVPALVVARTAIAIPFPSYRRLSSLMAY
jgi:hypothetical protein